MQDFERISMENVKKISGRIHSNHIHDSATKHVTGLAKYCDDITEPVGTLHAYLGVSEVAHANIKNIDLSAVESIPGVIGTITSSDIPGKNDISPTGQNDEPVFPVDRGHS